LAFLHEQRRGADYDRCAANRGQASLLQKHERGVGATCSA